MTPYFTPQYGADSRLGDAVARRELDLCCQPGGIVSPDGSNGVVSQLGKVIGCTPLAKSRVDVGWVPTLGSHVRHVGRVGPEPDMAVPGVLDTINRVGSLLVIANAQRNVARVAADETVRNRRTAGEFECVAMCRAELPVVTEPAVAIDAWGPGPQPTLGGLVDPRPESNFGGRAQHGPPAGRATETLGITWANRAAVFAGEGNATRILSGH